MPNEVNIGVDIPRPDIEEPAFGDEKTTFKFKSLSEYNPGESWVLMVYGPSKTGKSYFAGTSGPRTLYLNVGDGIETLLSPAFTSRYSEARRGIIMVDVRERLEKDPRSGKATIEYGFDIVTDILDHALSKFPDKFDTVVLDEATAFRRVAMNKAMELNTEQRKNVRIGRIHEYAKAEVGDYGIEMDMIQWFLGQYIPRFKSAGKHFLMLAHERQVFGKPEKIGGEAPLRKILPGFTGKTFPDMVPAYFDDVMHSEKALSGNTEVFRLSTIGTGMQVGGTRHGGIFPTQIQDPNFHQMLKSIRAAQSHTVKSK